jgi:hypothetical protein
MGDVLAWLPMGHHVEGLAFAVLLGASIFGFFWAMGALKQWELRRHRGYIAKYFEKRGERLVDARWKPLGPGAQSGGGKLFTVVYVDRAGNEHSALCKSGASGVYLTDDEISED